MSVNISKPNFAFCILGANIKRAGEPDAPNNSKFLTYTGCLTYAKIRLDYTDNCVKWHHTV